MSKREHKRIQAVFHAALKVPTADRDAWLTQRCGNDQRLLDVVRSLLKHDNPENDPLEQRLGEALDLPATPMPEGTGEWILNDHHEASVDGPGFVSRLLEVGVLSPEEIDALHRAIASGQPASDPQHIAAELVTQGKLTEYQAFALLKGQPELLIDKYLILDLLDSGGMGMVFKAIHRPMNRTVALKMISQHLLSSPELVKRFQREVRVAATLEHPNIVRSYDADQSRGVHFLVMEYVRGENLTTTVQRDGPLSVEAAVDCIRQAATGLGYAHQRGVIHRDIKPGNLMRNDEGLIKVLDLGLANMDEAFRLAQQRSGLGGHSEQAPVSPASSELTTTGTVLGTVSFMAPEQSLDAHSADSRADIYSLGCTLYYLLIGEAPYRGETIFQVFMQHREAAIPSLRDKRPDVSDQVEAVCRRMLSKLPEDRYQSMDDLLCAIDHCEIASSPESVASSSSAVTNTARGRSSDNPGPPASKGSQPTASTFQARTRIPPAVLAATMALLVFGGVYLWKQHMQEGSSGQGLSRETQGTDQRREGSPMSAADLLASGKYEWQIVERLPWGGSARSGAMSEDRLTLVFAKESQADRGDLWMTSRRSLDESWSEPIHLEALNSEARESMEWLSPDGCEMVFHRHDEGASTFTSRRDSTSDPWQPASKHWLGDDSWVGAVHFTSNDLAYVVTRSDAKGDWNLFLARRASPHARWHAESQINGPRINTRDRESEGSISADGRMLIFSRAPSDSFRADRTTLWVATRSNWEDSWSDPTPITSLRADGFRSPRLFADGKSLLVMMEDNSKRPSRQLCIAALRKKEEKREPSAADLLASGDWEWRLRERLPVPINTPRFEFSGDMSADGLTLIYSGTANGEENSDLFVVERPMIAAAWSQPRRLSDAINSEHAEFQPDISADGKTLTFQRYYGGQPYQSIHTSRKSLEGRWLQPEPHQLDTKDWQADFSTTPDGLMLVLTQGMNEKPYQKGLWFSWRPTTTTPWGPPQPFPAQINLLPEVWGGTLSGDGRLLIFVRKNETKQDDDLWMSTRDGWNAAWRKAVPIVGLNTDQFDGAPKLVMNDRMLIFSSKHQNSRDLFIAELVRKRESAQTVRD